MLFSFKPKIAITSSKIKILCSFFENILFWIAPSVTKLNINVKLVKADLCIYEVVPLSCTYSNGILLASLCHARNFGRED